MATHGGISEGYGIPTKSAGPSSAGLPVDLTQTRADVARDAAEQKRHLQGDGLPSSVVSNQPPPERIAPVGSITELETALSGDEKARGMRYLAQDGDKFKDELRRVRLEYPGMRATDVARSVLRHRENKESQSAEALFVDRMNRMSGVEFTEMRARAARGLPLLDK